MLHTLTFALVNTFLKLNLPTKMVRGTIKLLEINVRVLPIWETVWAFIFYGLVLIILLYFFRSQILARARFKHEIQIQRMEREKIEEYNDLKLRFLPTFLMSSELR